MKTLRLFVLTVTAVICLGAAQPTPAMQPVVAPMAAMQPVAPPMVVSAPVAAAPMVAPAATAPAPAVAVAAAPVAARVASDAPQAPPVTTPSTVVAPAPKKDSLGSVVGGALLQILIVILMIAIPIVLTPLVKWLLKKMKVEDLQTQQAIDDIVDKAVVCGLNYANEQAHKLRDNPVTGAEKLNLAADKAIVYLKDSKIVDKGAEYLKGLIEAKLGETRTTVPSATEKPVAPAVEEKPAEDKPVDDT